MKFQARRRELRRDVQQDLQAGLQMNPAVPQTAGSNRIDWRPSMDGFESCL